MFRFAEVMRRHESVPAALAVEHFEILSDRNRRNPKPRREILYQCSAFMADAFDNASTPLFAKHRSFRCEV